MQTIEYDAVVVGGGMVGAAMALGLARANWRILLLEHHSIPTFDPLQAPNIRVSALSHGSVELLKRLDAWQSVIDMRAAPYRQLQTWENSDNKIIFTASSVGLSELGYMVENSVLQLALWQKLADYPELIAKAATNLTDISKEGSDYYLTLDDGSRAKTALLIGADGNNSRVRKFAGIGLTGWQYRQACLLITVKSVASDITWQQFYPSGPKAFLPLYDDWGCLVWYDAPQRISSLSAMNNQELQREVLREFPDNLGEITIHDKAHFSLTRRHAQRYYSAGAVLIGDAAHTIHPLAGQGVNLGYRDVSALLDTLCRAKEQGEDYASDKVLAGYQSKRRADNLLMQSAMDLFYSSSKQRCLPIKLARNIALKMAENSGPLKKWALRYALGN